jgi:SnoaL-like domain
MDVERSPTKAVGSAVRLTAAEFVDVFAQGWALPKPERFLDHFRPLVHPEATFVQPMFPIAHGVDGFERLFRQVFDQIPDLTAKVESSAVSGDTVYIESRFTGTLGRKPIGFAACDRFRISEGLVIERRSFSDPLPVLVATLRRPTSWPRTFRMTVHRRHP